jgi:hypothetical protein
LFVRDLIPDGEEGWKQEADLAADIYGNMKGTITGA